MKRKKDSGSLWHRLHLHSLVGSRWTDVRIDRQTEQEDGETHKHRDTRSHCCTASSSHSAAAKGSRSGGCQKMNNRQTTSNREREREEKFGQNCIAQTKLEVRQSVSQTRTGSLQSPHKENRESSQSVHSTPADGPVGMLD